MESADSHDGQSPFPPIAELAFLSDCESNALVGPNGNVEWLCLPRPDGPSVFGTTLDRSAGGFRLAPTGVTVPAERSPPTTCDEAFARMERTAAFWRGWINQGEFPEHRWQSYLQRSALTLKGLSYAPTGAMLAAATTSLPETPGGKRNYDYRYTWIRDATFMLWGLYTLGFEREANDFFYFVADVCGGEEN